LYGAEEELRAVCALAGGASKRLCDAQLRERCAGIATPRIRDDMELEDAGARAAFREVDADALQALRLVEGVSWYLAERSAAD
jgi:hypothetical protein